ncbi:Uncharacterised protein [Yersinia pseudotuberculosis]|uniref:Uncharacterized protein n=1 Tax=Yersinia pseudotuberculosis TaxID=633 RepID=A0A380QEF0_YERPU|nr:Uncharacterised protein [Yersinia pseudotuberculosis]
MYFNYMVLSMVLFVICYFLTKRLLSLSANRLSIFVCIIIFGGGQFFIFFKGEVLFMPFTKIFLENNLMIRNSALFISLLHILLFVCLFNKRRKNQDTL